MNELSLKERRANWFRDAWMSVAVGLVPMISCVLVAALVATHRFAVNGQPVGMAVALGVLAPLGLLSLIPFVLARAGSRPTDSN